MNTHNNDLITAKKLILMSTILFVLQLVILIKIIYQDETQTSILEDEEVSKHGIVTVIDNNVIDEQEMFQYEGEVNLRYDSDEDKIYIKVESEGKSNN